MTFPFKWPLFISPKTNFSLSFRYIGRSSWNDISWSVWLSKAKSTLLSFFEIILTVSCKRSNNFFFWTWKSSNARFVNSQTCWIIELEYFINCAEDFSRCSIRLKIIFFDFYWSSEKSSGMYLWIWWLRSRWIPIWFIHKNSEHSHSSVAFSLHSLHFSIYMSRNLKIISIFGLVYFTKIFNITETYNSNPTDYFSLLRLWNSHKFQSSLTLKGSAV